MPHRNLAQTLIQTSDIFFVQLLHHRQILSRQPGQGSSLIPADLTGDTVRILMAGKDKRQETAPKIALKPIIRRQPDQLTGQNVRIRASPLILLPAIGKKTGHAVEKGLIFKIAV